MDLPPSGQPENRRAYRRVRFRIPIELTSLGSNSMISTAMSDVSLGGCYVEMMFTLPKGTNVEIKITSNADMRLRGRVVTADPQVGNGIKFMRMEAADVESLRSYLDSLRDSENTE